MVIWDELVHGKKLVESAKISQHQIAKLFSMDNGDRPPAGNLGRSNKVTEVSK
jgi:hypothetical protein